MDNLLRLIDAICEAFDSRMMPTEDATFCNLATQYVLARFNYTKMDGMTADQMFDFLTRSEDWSPVDMGDAQDLANAGRVVVAGMQADPHGHVVVIRPGRPEYSGKWATNTPKCSNVGLRPWGRIGDGVSFAFKEIPKFFLLKQEA